MSALILADAERGGGLPGSQAPAGKGPPGYPGKPRVEGAG